MNAKKIMGAVLVAFLAAALFIGAGAAIEDGDVVFVNQNVSGLSGTWTSGANTITAIAAPGDSSYGYFTGKIVEGAYTNGTGNNAITITVKYPAISVVGLGNEGEANSEYQFIPGTLYKATTGVGVTTAPLNASLTSYSLYLTYPNGTEVLMADDAAIEGALMATNAALGQYSIRAVFDASYFINGTLYDDRITAPVTFTVVEEGAVSISASADQVLKSEPIKITIVGQPGIIYNVSYDEYAFKGNGYQLGLPGVTAIGTTVGTKDNFSFTMPNTGKVEFVVAGNVTGDSEKITVKQLSPVNPDAKKAVATIKFTKGTISGKTDAASYFVGDKVKVSGTTSDGDIENITIKGTNFYADLLYQGGYAHGTTTVEGLVENKITYGDGVAYTFEFELDTGVITNEHPSFQGKKLDVGTYTLTLETANAKTTVAVVLKQPFISIVEAPEVVVQGTEVDFVVNAEASPNGIAYYIFGTNFFAVGKQADADEDIPNQFTITLKEEQTVAELMAAGQYFAVFQHPMYDGDFNIYAVDQKFYLNTTGNADGTDETYLFSFDARQTANAAQALCDALDSQNIDDMYVKYSFFVVGEDESFTINEIPTEVAQGTTFTVSGVSTAAAGEIVQVEMISTAFAAVPKENVGSAAFIVVTAEVAEDGTWEVTLDTSDLNVDEYSLKVSCGDDTWKNVKINVVEAADEPVTPPTDEPGQDEPGQDEPEAPATPGFGALAALAGLGAVAVLLLRRE